MDACSRGRSVVTTSGSDDRATAPGRGARRWRDLRRRANLRRLGLRRAVVVPGRGRRAVRRRRARPSPAGSTTGVSTAIRTFGGHRRYVQREVVVLLAARAAKDDGVDRLIVTGATSGTDARRTTLYRYWPGVGPSSSTRARRRTRAAAGSRTSDHPDPTAAPGASASSWACAAICCATSAVWIPWNKPSSQPTSWAWAIRSSASDGVWSCAERQRDALAARRRARARGPPRARAASAGGSQRAASGAASSRGALRTSSSSCLIMVPIRMTFAGWPTSPATSSSSSAGPASGSARVASSDAVLSSSGASESLTLAV